MSGEMAMKMIPQSTSVWRESCNTAIIPATVQIDYNNSIIISSTHRDSIFFQAGLSRPVCNLAVRIMNMFEQGSLKGKLNSLVAKPEFKQQYLSLIRALLPKEDQISILEVGKNCTISEILYY